jgi:hypothetical protein
MDLYPQYSTFLCLTPKGRPLRRTKSDDLRGFGVGVFVATSTVSS